MSDNEKCINCMFYKTIQVDICPTDDDEEPDGYKGDGYACTVFADRDGIVFHMIGYNQYDEHCELFAARGVNDGQS